MKTYDRQIQHDENGQRAGRKTRFARFDMEEREFSGYPDFIRPDERFAERCAGAGNKAFRIELDPRASRRVGMDGGHDRHAAGLANGRDTSSHHRSFRAREMVETTGTGEGGLGRVDANRKRDGAGDLGFDWDDALAMVSRRQ